MVAKRKRRSGFTMVELIVVILIVVILGAVATPGILSYIEAGRQTNRMDIARSLYLGAQNQLTELRVTRGLDSTVGITRERDPDSDDVLIIAELTDGVVFPKLGVSEWPDEGNEALVHYISKPAGQSITDPSNALMARLLSTVIVNREAVDSGAILIEFNIETGVVMSVFYSDRLSSGEYFGYFGFDDGIREHSERNIRPLASSPVPLGIRGMGDDGYEPTARRNDRRQGYYGVGKTGQLDDLGIPIVSLHDGSNVPLDLSDHPDTAIRDEYSNKDELGNNHENKNSLHAVVTMPSDIGKDDFDLLLNGKPLPDGDDAPTLVMGASTDDGEFTAYYLILDYLRRDGSKRKNENINNMSSYFIDDDGNIGSIYVSVRLRNGIHASSNEWHPYFDGEADGSGNFGIATGRHLYNIRHAAKRNFVLRDHIDFSDPVSAVNNFTPIADYDDYGNLVGGFSGSFDGSRRYIRNLSVNVPGNAGLFEHINKGGRVRNLTLENPSVASSGADAGAVSGSNEGEINTVYLRYSADSTGRTIRVVRHTGGITGNNFNDGIIEGAVFVSPLPEEHIKIGTQTGSGVGGIAGVNTTGRIRNAMFLALAPKVSDSLIVPIAYDGDMQSTYYLAGSLVRPDEDAINQIIDMDRDGFNMPETVSVGSSVTEDRKPRPLTTWEFYSLLNQDDGFTLDGWTKRPGLTNQDQVDPEYLAAQKLVDPDYAAEFENIYPYPYIPLWYSAEDDLRIIPGKSEEWPLAFDWVPRIKQQLSYYEVTETRTSIYGSMAALESTNTNLVNDGYLYSFQYASELMFEIGGMEYVLRDTSSSDTPSWVWETQADADLQFTNLPVWGAWTSIDSEPAESYGLFLNNNVLERLSEGSFINFEVRQGTDNRLTYGARFNPLFANTVIEAPATATSVVSTQVEATFGTDDNPYSIRSPRHLNNISYVGANSALNFAQGQGIDFERYWKEVQISAGASGLDPESIMSFPESSVVTGTFQGFYDGDGLDIRNVTAQIGLFSVIGTSGEVGNFTINNATITARIGFGGGGVTGINNGTISNVTLANGNISATGLGNNSVGGIAAINNNAILNSTVTRTNVTAPNGTAGGVTGTNNSRAVIDGPNVSGTTVSITGVGAAGGIAGNNVAAVPGVPALSTGGTITGTVTVSDNSIHAGSGRSGPIVGSNGGSITP